MTRIDNKLLKEIYDYFSQDFNSVDKWEYTDAKKAEIAAQLRDYIPAEDGYPPIEMRSF